MGDVGRASTHTHPPPCSVRSPAARPSSRRCAPQPAVAQRCARPKSPASAPITGVRYEVTADRAALGERQLHVVTTFGVSGTAPVVLSLPAWTPGAYEIVNFARTVSEFGATQGADTLRWDKADYDSWRALAEAGGAGDGVVRRHRRHARQRDVVDEAGLRAVQRHERVPLSRRAVRRLRGHGRDQDRAGLPHRHGHDARRPRRARTAPRTTTSSWTCRSSSASSISTARSCPGRRCATRRTRAGSVRRAMRTQGVGPAQAIIPARGARVRRGAVGQLHAHADRRLDVRRDERAGARRTRTSTSSRRAGNGSDFQPSLYAHEIFHAWNVKRLRPADLVPYRYDRPQPTGWLWVSEGITDYYADLARGARRRRSTRAGFYALTSGKIGEIAARRPSRSRTRRSTRGSRCATAPTRCTTRRSKTERNQ